MATKYPISTTTLMDVTTTPVAGQSVVYGGSAGEWRSPSVFQPIIRAHDTTHSPFALYQLDGGLTDTSGNSRPALVQQTLANAIYTRASGLTGWYGNDSDGQSLDTAGNAAFALTGDLTVECLLTLHSENGSPAVLWTIDDGTVSQRYAEGFVYTTTASYGIGFTHSVASGTDTVRSAHLPPLGQTCHIAWRRASNVVTIFLNGVSVGSDTLAAPNASAGTPRLRIGNNYASDSYTHGAVASFKVMPTALTDAQIYAEYARTMLGAEVTAPRGYTYHRPTGSPSSHFKFDGNLTDEYGNETLSVGAGTAIYGELTPGLTGIRLQNGFRLDGESSGTSVLDVTGAITAQCLLLLTGTAYTTEPPVIIDYSGDTNGETSADNILWRLGLDSTTNRWRVGHETGAGSDQDGNDGTKGPVFGAVAHVAMTRNSAGTAYNVYVNGRLVYTKTGLTAATDGASGTLHIGAGLRSAAADGFVVGGIASVVIYLSERTPGEIFEAARQCGFVNDGTAALSTGRRTVSGTVSLTATDEDVFVTTASVAATLTLPLASEFVGRTLTIADDSGNASVNNVTINRAGSDTIDGATSTVMTADWSVLTLKSNGSTGWRIV